MPNQKELDFKKGGGGCCGGSAKRVNATALSDYREKSAVEFIKLYGTHYIHQIKNSATLFGDITVESDSQEDIQNITSGLNATLTVSASAGGGSAGGNVGYNETNTNNKKNTSTNTKVTASCKVEGLSVNRLVNNIETLAQAVNDFSEEAKRTENNVYSPSMFICKPWCQLEEFKGIKNVEIKDYLVNQVKEFKTKALNNLKNDIVSNHSQKKVREAAELFEIMDNDDRRIVFDLLKEEGKSDVLKDMSQEFQKMNEFTILELFFGEFCGDVDNIFRDRCVKQIHKWLADLPIMFKGGKLMTANLLNNIPVNNFKNQLAGAAIQYLKTDKPNTDITGMVLETICNYGLFGSPDWPHIRLTVNEKNTETGEITDVAIIKIYTLTQNPQFNTGEYFNKWTFDAETNVLTN